MPIELDTFQQILQLPPNDLADLVETVMAGISANMPLAYSPKNKIELACIIMNHTNTMLEHCGCVVSTLVTSAGQKGQSIVKYQTGDGWSTLRG